VVDAGFFHKDKYGHRHPSLTLMPVAAQTPIHI